MRRSEVQKMIRKSDVQSNVFSYLWSRRGNVNGSRLKDIAVSCRDAGVAKNGIDALIKKGIVEAVEIDGKIVRGAYKVSQEITK